MGVNDTWVIDRTAGDGARRGGGSFPVIQMGERERHVVSDRRDEGKTLSDGA